MYRLTHILLRCLIWRSGSGCCRNEHCRVALYIYFVIIIGFTTTDSSSLTRSFRWRTNQYQAHYRTCLAAFILKYSARLAVALRAWTNTSTCNCDLCFIYTSYSIRMQFFFQFIEETIYTILKKQSSLDVLSSRNRELHRTRRHP